MKNLFITTFILSCVFCCSVTPHVNAQADKGFMQDMAIGVETGLFGHGVTLAAPLSPLFKLKVGFNTLPYKYDSSIDIATEGFLPSDISGSPLNDIVKDISLDGSLSNVELKMNHFKAIVDFYPFPDGIFSLSAGFYVGKTAIAFDGMIDGYAALVNQYGENPVFEAGNVVLQPGSNGSFSGEIRLGNTFKPYFGIGLGRTIANSRVGFKFDLGVVYQGEIKVKSPNVLSGDYNVNDGLKAFDLPVSDSVLELWPVLNFSLSYRIF
jgi:hypothetical protein